MVSTLICIIVSSLKTLRKQDLAVKCPELPKTNVI